MRLFQYMVNTALDSETDLLQLTGETQVYIIADH